MMSFTRLMMLGLLLVLGDAAPLRSMRGAALSQRTVSKSQQTIFPPHQHVCEGGSARNSFLRAHTHIVCESVADDASSLRCSAGLLSPLLSIRDVNVQCERSASECTLHYYMDYTPFALFLLTCVVITLVTLLLALPMYFAVQKFVQCMHHVERQRLLRKARLVKHVSALYLDEMKLEGYGSFGGRMHTLGNYSDSLASILDYDPTKESDVNGLKYRHIDNSQPLESLFVDPSGRKAPAAPVAEPVRAPDVLCHNH